ncbi:hypothetical protein CR513_10351, partial [Mucuna pruriens]
MCKANSIVYTGLVERGRIFKFLHGLNSEYDPIRVQILGHTKDTCYKRYGNEKVLERMGGNKGLTQMWVNQTTSDKENVVEHPSTLQLDQDIQAFSKEEMDRLRALINSTSKPLSSYGLTMNGKSSFNISGSVPQIIWILDSRATNHMTPFPSYFTSYHNISKKQLITIANGDHVPIAESSNIQLHSSLSLHNGLTMGRTIGVAKVQVQVPHSSSQSLSVLGSLVAIAKGSSLAIPRIYAIATSLMNPSFTTIAMVDGGGSPPLA